MGVVKDLTNLVFGRLTVIEYAGLKERKSGRRAQWKCLCSCGKVLNVVGSDLLRGGSTSCGCYKNEKIGKLNLTHGQQRKGKRTSEHRSWRHMKSRCYNPNVERYPNYGGKGIKVCDRWLNSFENFFEDMGPKPSPLHSLDRFPDTNGDYEPSNCRWGTREQQSRNTTKNHWIEFGGERMILTDWAKRLGTSAGNINRMMKKKSISETIEYHLNKKNR